MNCSNCGTAIDRKLDKRSKNHFCSRACSATFNNKHAIKRKLEGICIDCGVSIKSNRKRCTECRAKVKSPLDYTVGEFKELGKHKTSQALHAQLRGYGKRLYDKSDMPKRCVVCGYGKHYEVCHIRPIKDFEDDELLRDVHSVEDNLIALCPTHHWELDNDKMSVSDRLKILFSKDWAKVVVFHDSETGGLGLINPEYYK